MKKILDPQKKEFYLYENTKQFSFEDLKKVLSKTHELYDKAVKFHKEQGIENPFIPSVNQYHAIERLTHPQYRHLRNIALGGGINGGKSIAGAFWIISKSLQNPRSFYLVGRRFQNVIETTTLETFFKMLRILGVPEKMYKYNYQQHILRFSNGSKIIFLGMDFKNKDDPNFNKFRGLELTGAFLDEANELLEWTVKELKNRLGRNNQFKDVVKPVGNIKKKKPKSKDDPIVYVDEVGNEFADKDATIFIEPIKTLYTFNPDRNWIYNWFFDPWKKDLLPDDTYYQPSLMITNPFATVENLEVVWKNGEAQRQKYLLGNFDYTDGDGVLIPYDNIKAIFTNVTADVSHNFMTVDVAGESGSDNTVFTLWRGWEIFKIDIKKGMSQDEIIDTIINYSVEFNIPIKNVAVDAIGLGEGIARSPRIKGVFIYKSSNSPMLNEKQQRTKTNKYGEIELIEDFGNEQYRNLRSQTAWILVNKINMHEMSVKCNVDVSVRLGDKDWLLREVIERELAVMRDKNYGRDELKRQLIPKQDMKEILGNSPDVLDTFLMRGVFDLISQYDIISERKVVPLTERKFYKKRQTKRITYS